MNTPSHLIMTAALSKAMPRWAMPRSAVLLGSVAPDVALWVLSLGGFVYFESILGWGRRETFRHMYDDLYFNDPYWIAAHNLLQAPLVLLFGLGVARLARVRWPRASRWVAWFLAACLLHSVVDILTHHDDGPLVFFPFEWSTRFASPVSYWDHRHFGSKFARFELVFDLALLGYLLVQAVFERLPSKRLARGGS
jgi:membrane-bound metal-dependent hydrolase YbcI (DUF457 family)